MSINSAMLAGVSGLVANSSALAAISDNIANVNTVAYKRNQVNFANVVTAQAVKGKYSAGGVQGVTRQFVSQQGLIQSSSSTTDLAISGDGFFVVANKGAGLAPADPRLFTRQGSFSVDEDGFMVNDAGLYLQGWPVQANGTFAPNPSDLSAMNSINVKNLGAAVSPTANVSITANVDKVNPTDPAPIDFTVIDAAGGRHTLRLTMVQNGPNDWTGTLDAVPSSEVGGVPISTGSVMFNTDGTIDMANSDVFGAPGATTVTVNWDPVTLGLPTQDINFDLSKVSQYDDPSAVTQTTQDGAGPGNVVQIEVGEDGVVSAVYDNNQVRQIAKVGVATFPNADGLQQVSGNAYRATMDAGDYTVKEAGFGGAGNISPSSLEASTVDLSAEFTGLIQTQRAYSASSKIITTADQMLEELINIKR